tara:strand:+ start:456 stop:1649 length:1194 start_codon:yes stop_codon:yes gene_type:complete
MSHTLIFHIRGIRLHFTREFLVNEGDVLRIGRIESNDLVIKDQRISRCHLELQWRGGRFVVRDLNSKYGTFLHNESMKEPFVWDTQEVLGVGDTEIYYEPLEVAQSTQSNTEYNVVVSQANDVSVGMESWAESINFYLDQDLTPFKRKREMRAPDQMVKLLLRTLFVPFVILFGLFIAFPTFLSCMITLGYAGVALVLSNSLLAKTSRYDQFSLPITSSIHKMHKRILMKINRLDDTDRGLLGNIGEEINKFVHNRLPRMEKDIYTLNQSMTPGMSGRLDRKRDAMQTKLEEADDPIIVKQLQRSINIMDKQISLHKKIKNLLMSLVLKLEDFKSQLEILEGTIVAQGFHEVPVEFTNHFIELQRDIDEFYEEYNRLDQIQRLEEGEEILNNSGAST